VRTAKNGRRLSNTPNHVVHYIREKFEGDIVSEIRPKAYKPFRVGVDASDKEIFTTLRKTTRLEHKDGTRQTNEIRFPEFVIRVLIKHIL
jgi:hypothetical protein